MIMGEKELAKLPEHLQQLFVKLPNPGSDEVVKCFPETGAAKSGGKSTVRNFGPGGDVSVKDMDRTGHDDAGGSAARFFYSAKADKNDRIGSRHPTVKPVDLMSWLCRLITPPGGVVLDPFAGSGTTGEAAWREGFTCHLIEREEEYQADIAERLKLADKGPVERKQRAIKQVDDAGPLFGAVANDNGGGQVSWPQEQVLCRAASGSKRKNNRSNRLKAVNT
jgi:hypothetical protein